MPLIRALQRRSARRSYPVRKRIYKKRRAGIPRMNALTRMPRNRIHFATFRVQLSDAQTGGVFNEVNSGVAANRSSHIPVNLDMFPRTQNYKRLYQTYKICKVKYEFIPVQTRGRINNPGADSNMPTFSTLINRQSTSFPGNLA